MFKNKYFVLLSFVAFGLIWQSIGWRIRVMRNGAFDIDNLGLWGKACGKFIKLCLLCIVAPVALVSTIYNLLSPDLHALNIDQDTIINVALIVLLSLLYMLGVYAAYSLLKWKKINLDSIDINQTQCDKNNVE